MKKILFLLFAALLAVACDPYDDSEILSQLEKDTQLHEEQQKTLDEHNAQILELQAKLDTVINRINTQITDIQSIYSLVEKTDYITEVVRYANVSPIYTEVTLKSGKYFRIYDGVQGAPGTIGKDGEIDLRVVSKDDKLDFSIKDYGDMKSDQLYWWMNNALLRHNGEPIAINMETFTPKVLLVEGVAYWGIRGVPVLDENDNMVPLYNTIKIVKEAGKYYWATSSGTILTDQNGNKVIASSVVEVDDKQNLVIDGVTTTIAAGVQKVVANYIASENVIKLVDYKESAKTITISVDGKRYTFQKTITAIEIRDTEVKLDLTRYGSTSGGKETIIGRDYHGTIDFIANIGPEWTEDRLYVVPLLSKVVEIQKVEISQLNFGISSNYDKPNASGIYIFDYATEIASRTGDIGVHIEFYISQSVAKELVETTQYLMVDVSSEKMTAKQTVPFEFKLEK